MRYLASEKLEIIRLVEGSHLPVKRTLDKLGVSRPTFYRWYHRRSCVESKMHCIKLLGQSVMARDFDRQVAEIQIRIAVLNRYTALGIPVTEPIG